MTMMTWRTMREKSKIFEHVMGDPEKAYVIYLLKRSQKVFLYEKIAKETGFEDLQSLNTQN